MSFRPEAGLFRRDGMVRGDEFSGAGPATFAQVLAAFDSTVQVGGVNQRTSLFTSDLYTVDGVSGKVATIVDHYDPTHAIAQATSAQQVAVPAADATLNGAMTLPFAGSQYYQSNRAASAWRFMHSGIGFWCGVWVSTLSATRYLFGTMDHTVTAGNSGIFASVAPTSLLHRVYNVGTLAINVNLATVTYPSGSACTTAVSALDGAAQEVQVRSDGAQISTSAAGPFAAVDPVGSMVVGAHTGLALALQARLGFLLYAPFRPSDAQLALLNSYLLPKYGVTI